MFSDLQDGFPTFVGWLESSVHLERPTLETFSVALHIQVANSLG